jgi:predicted ATPase
MKVKVKNLGLLKQAEFVLGDLTIICGGNNTGKTYATYALFGFLYSWEEFLSIEIDSQKINQLLDQGVIRLEIQEYVDKIDEIISQACREYTQKLPRIFASSKSRFKNTEFDIIIDINNVHFLDKFESITRLPSTGFFLMTKVAESMQLIVTLLDGRERVDIPIKMLSVLISDALKKIIFKKILPNPFIASAERTGAAIFRKELDFSRNRLLKDMSQLDKKTDPRELLFKAYQSYSLPIEKNVDFMRELETISKKNSFLVEQYPDVLADFADIIGGNYVVTRDEELYYVPKNGKSVKLSMDESSSAVRSLLDIGFYLRHEAQLGDLLMVDEPELNLHPENQRRVARLFARLVNIGIKVFITTHSDYIVKELNTLIMLNHDQDYLKQIAEKEGYKAEEMLSSEKIKVYITEEALVQVEGKQRKVKCQTLTPADIDPKLGIDARSFDKTIETMNRIQEAIVWGED